MLPACLSRWSGCMTARSAELVHSLPLRTLATAFLITLPLLAGAAWLILRSDFLALAFVLTAIIAVWFGVMRVIGQHIAERQSVEEALQHLASNANCLLWYANVEERDGAFVWTVLVTDDAAA